MVDGVSGKVMSIVREQDWDVLGKQFKEAKPFPSICIDNFLVTDFANEVASAYPDFNAAQEMGKEFTGVNERLKVQITEPRKFPDSIAQLAEAIGSQDFLDKLTVLTGIKELHWDPKFVGGGMHLTGPTGILDVHVDFNFEKKLDLYRRLNILIYLNPVWQSGWGGSVELWDRDVENCMHSFEPVFNRCVLFETSDYSFHGVKQVKCPENMTRNSFAAYYYSEDAGEHAGFAYGGNHTTIFKARPDTKIYFNG